MRPTCSRRITPTEKVIHSMWLADSTGCLTGGHTHPPSFKFDNSLGSQYSYILLDVQWRNWFELFYYAGTVFFSFHNCTSIFPSIPLELVKFHTAGFVIFVFDAFQNAHRHQNGSFCLISGIVLHAGTIVLHKSLSIQKVQKYSLIHRCRHNGSLWRLDVHTVFSFDVTEVFFPSPNPWLSKA